MIATEIRQGAYYDSVVLMQLQRALSALDGVQDAAVVMGLPSNLDLLRQSNLFGPVAASAGMDDLVIAVRAETLAAAEVAIGQFDQLLAQRATASSDEEYLPKTLAAAARMSPDADWVLVSIPGRYAAAVAEEALRLGKHLFLYSDNVSMEDEVRLKQLAVRRAQLLLGPDCGTAIINGVGLGFANKVRRGNIGIVSASGTGLQHVAASVHHLGMGISHALGTGGRDLSDNVGGLTTLQCLQLLAHDPDTHVIVLLSKPPSPNVSNAILSRASSIGKPLVVYLVGSDSRDNAPVDVPNLAFATSLQHAADLAVQMARGNPRDGEDGTEDAGLFDGYGHSQQFVRGLFSGGTLALESVQLLRRRGHSVQTGMVGNGAPVGHRILDLGDDEFTIGRLHPMMDNDLRIRLLQSEASDPEVAVVLLDCVLGFGAHPDPASELAPAIAEACRTAAQANRRLEVVVALIGTDEDPQEYEAQRAALILAGASVFRSNDRACARAADIVEQLARVRSRTSSLGSILEQPFRALNVGLSSFATSIEVQGGRVQHVDWRPPAGGDERLSGILARMKQASN